MVSANQPVILVVGADPEPDEILIPANRDRSMLAANSSAPEASDTLEMQRGMTRVRLQTRKIPLRCLLNIWREKSERRPEAGTSSVPQKGSHRPASKSARAWSARRSNLPAFTSASNCRSHLSQRNSSSQESNAFRSSSESDTISFSMRSSAVMPKILAYRAGRPKPKQAAQRIRTAGHRPGRPVFTRFLPRRFFSAGSS